MEVSLPGVIGAAVGFYVGWLDWKILKGILQAAETKNRQAGGDGGVVARYRAPIGALIFGIPVIGFPIVGYWAASLLAG
ncbi:NADH dehydrogenase [Alphaproteobacteria bacterium AO1-B]|nr:NADH dehydrogenase [Alphaproteobacteria bacterium AO1-B]